MLFPFFRSNLKIVSIFGIEIKSILAMEKNKGVKTFRVVCIVVVILSAILGLNQAYSIVPLPDVVNRTVGILNLLALIGLAYSTVKMLNKEQ